MQERFTGYVEQGVSADDLAAIFLKEYFAEKELVFPINPFQMLTDLQVPFIMRPFKKYEGIYIPAEDVDDFPVVGINLKRPITRQRFTAAHELCHHLKDSKNGYMCNLKSAIERYAEEFAAGLLMPLDALKTEVDKYLVDGYISFDDVLKVAEYFGVSFETCLFRIAYRLHKIEGDISPDNLRKKKTKFKPDIRRKNLGLNSVLLYEQLFNAIGDRFDIVSTPFTCNKFKNEYIFFDSRMEGINIDQELASEIVIDIRENKQESKYCTIENQDIIEVAGLTIAYDYAFDNANGEINIYDAKHINEKLFSTAPCPEYGGTYRQSNTLVLGAKFETVDYHDIQQEMYLLDKDIQTLLASTDTLSNSEYVEWIARIHYKMTVIHAFRDGNGRTSRAFINMLLLRRHMPPVFFKDKEKTKYKDALADVDATGRFENLYEVFYRGLLISNAALSDFKF
ncbi:MAG: ImmA/IrrE family metallo-endopeptidase [Lachnospiraceae bacterium]|nr:ImmA/IrrE family metallo-endopeptidase [Lachnospiraceae bacterium]